MSKAKITLIGWNNYDSDKLWSKFSVPDECEYIDKDILINIILMQCGEFETLYADIDFMSFAIGLWCEKWRWTMLKIDKALAIEYSPLENYDRHEDWTDTGSRDTSGTVNQDNETENKVSAYNESTYQPNTKQTSDTDTTTTVNEEAASTHTGRVHGNIGVTTSQQMLQSELELATYNYYEQLADIFKTELCVFVYE